ncbi:MAG: efflux RND transporter periplasmic adaptor subunit [Prevotella sp.]|nr:efflux RND transporter periplasmic adaptor subunit [Prevotella sp.]
MKKKNILSLCAAIAAFTACSSGEKDYDASGVFETTEVIVSAKTTGEILSLNVEEGQDVKRNEMLGLIDTLQLSLHDQQLAANQSAADSKRLDANRQVASIRQQIINLQKEKKRFSDLLAANAATQKQVDDISYQIEVLQRQLSATQEQIGSNNQSAGNQSMGIKAQRAQTEDQIRKAHITSPITGTVLTKYAEQGEYATPGRALFKVGDISRMRLRAYITAPQLTTLKVGQKVKVFADMGETESKAYEGTVEWISDKAEFTPKTIQTRDERANLVYAIKVAVKNDGMIKRGMYGDVKF